MNLNHAILVTPEGESDQGVPLFRVREYAGNPGDLMTEEECVAKYGEENRSIFRGSVTAKDRPSLH
jgi:hypothetical protein